MALRTNPQMNNQTQATTTAAATTGETILNVEDYDLYKTLCLPPHSPQCLIVDKLYQLSFNFHSHQNIFCIPCTMKIF